MSAVRAVAPRGTVVLLHGAGTGTDVPTLRGVGQAMAERDWDVLYLEQPYRVRGRKAPAPATHLDEVVTTVIEELVDRSRPLVLVGRSSGARVACRLARKVDAALVVALGFPLLSPTGASRQAELDHTEVPVFIVQGTKDSFGMPRRSSRLRREVYRVDRANHALVRPKADRDPLADIIAVVVAKIETVGQSST